jgi:hypothetical protein
MSELDERLAARVRETYERTPPLGAAAGRRLAEALRHERSGGVARWRRLLGLGPAPRLQALGVVTAAAGLLAVGVLIGWGARGRFDRVEAPAPIATRNANGGATRTIEFVLVAPGASRVALVGDFNGWDVEATPMRRTPSGGAWTVAIPLATGRHLYAFVVDGERWLPDPVAPLAPEDGFGTRNSVVVVGDPGST